MKSKSNSGVIEAAGGLVWRNGTAGREIVVIHRSRYDDWTLPKGKLKKNESWEDAAVREIKEETGCDVELESFAGSSSYMVGDRPKVVLYWNARLIDEGEFEASEEVDQRVWVTPEEAVDRIQYLGEKTLLLRAIDSD